MARCLNMALHDGCVHVVSCNGRTRRSDGQVGSVGESQLVLTGQLVNIRIGNRSRYFLWFSCIIKEFLCVCTVSRFQNVQGHHF